MLLNSGKLFFQFSHKAAKTPRKQELCAFAALREIENVKEHSSYLLNDIITRV